jgi:chorismate synthase
MSGSTRGALFRVTTWGESHGPAVGCVVDGCPPGIVVDLGGIQRQMDRRRPGQSKLVSARSEPDRVEVLSGLWEGRALGTPICLLVRNEDARPGAYDEIRDLFRPSHADFTWERKMGIRDPRGGGRASARETAGRVLAGALAQQVLAQRWGVEVRAWVDQVGPHRAGQVESTAVPTVDEVDANPTRCPDSEVALEMAACIEAARRDGDTVGGAITCVATGLPAGWGEPVWDKLEAELGAACLSIPACRGVEIGAGFAAVGMRGSQHNDVFLSLDERGARTATNHSGGVQGGISNGMPLRLRVAFKPVATIFQPQHTVDRDGQPTSIQPRGRHDPCVVPRAVPIVEAVVACVLVDLALRQAARGR